MKKIVCLVAALIMLLPLLLMPAFAATFTIVAEGLTVADNKNKSSYADGAVTITGAGGLFSGTENTVTITNIGANKANITFDYSATGYASFSESAASGSIDMNLEAGGTRTMKIKGKSGYKDATLVLSNFTYTALIEGTATITYGAQGSVTVDGSAFASGSTTGTLTETGATLVATPVSGASFVAWVNADNNAVISQNATFQLKPYAATMNIQAVFTKADQPAYFMTNSTMYTDLSAALTAASGGDKKVVVISSGTLTAGSTYNIPSDVSLLVPYSTSDLAIDSSTTIDDSGGQGGTLLNANMELVTLDSEGTSNSKVTAVMEPNTSVLYTLTIPSGTIMNVSGKLVVGGALVAGTNSTTGVCGATGGAHSNIQMDGTINVKSGGVLSTCGYILGNGTITAESGGEVYQPFVLMDHKDGHYLYAAKENDRWPVYRYSIQNIRCPLVLNSGSDMYGYCAVFTRKNTFASARFNPSVMQVVGSGSDTALFLVNGGSMTMTYTAGKTVSVTSSTNNNSKGYYNKVGITTMTFNGDAALGSIELSVVVMGSNYNMTSTKSEVPIPYNFQLVQKSGTFNVANNMALLPGSSFTVNSGANMTVAGGKNLVVYDGLRDYATRAESVTLDGDDETGGSWPLYHYPTPDNLQSGGFSRTAELIINGTLTVNGNLGGTVQTGSTTGTIVMGTSAGSSATGTFGMQNATQSLLVMDIAGSCGKTVRTLSPQVFTANSTTPIPLQAGKSYVATGNGTNTISSYTYSVYGTHNGSATTEIKTNLNATVMGTWQCAEEYHSYKVTSNTATCTEAGQKTSVCTACGDTKTEEAAIKEHTGGEPVSENVTAPTCSATGSHDEVVYCTVCNTEVSRETVTDAATGAHAGGSATCKELAKCATCGQEYGELGDHTPGAAATCTTAQTCTVCSNTLKDALGHSEVTSTETIEAATCTEAGSYKEITSCSTCNEVLNTETKTDPAKGHTDGKAVTENEKEATCTVNGSYDTVTYCTVCDVETSRQTTVVEAKGHDWVDATCTAPKTCSVCGDTEGEAKGHTAGNAVTENNVDATCTADGSYDTVVYCSVCNAELSRETSTTPALGHTEGDAVTENNEDATCTADGSYDTVVYCTVCDSELSRVKTTVSAVGHTLGDTWEPGENGQHYKTCTVCGGTEAAAHTEGEAVTENSVAATCTADGSYDTVINCTGCGAEISRVTTTVSASGHTPGEAVTENIKAASCTATGSYDSVIYCATCAAEISRETSTTDMLSHDMAPATCILPSTCRNCTYTVGEAKGHTDGEAVIENEVEAACTTDGKRETVVYCVTCDEETSRETIVYKAPGHTEVTDDGKAATCTETGLTEGKHCSVCGEVTDAQEVIDALGHGYEGVVTEATCTEGGYTTYTCNVCSHSYVGDQVEANGHEWAEASCTDAKTCKTCGATEGDALGHSFTTSASGELVSKATCVDKAVYRVKCDNCDAVSDDMNVEIGETDSENHVGETEIRDASAATCTQAGYTGDTYCKACDNKIRDGETISAVGHDPSAAVKENEVAATCGQAGSYDSVVKCAACGTELSREQIAVPATGNHNHTPTVTPPTCVADGYTTYTCACSDSYTTDVVSALGHIFINYAANTDGTTETATCENTACSETHTRAVEADNNVVVVKPAAKPNGEDNAEVTVNKDLLIQIQNQQQELQLESDLLELIFNNKAVEKIITDHDDKKTISIGVKNVTPADSTDKLVFDIHLKVDGNKVDHSDFGDGSVTVTIPLDSLNLSDKQTVKVWYVKDGVRQKEMDHTHDRDGKKVHFQTSHFSEYEIETVCAHSWTDGTCMNCGTVCEHSYVDGKCNYCGKTQTANATVNVFQANLRLQDLIKLGFYFNVNTEEEVISAGAILWTAEEFEKETVFTLEHTQGKTFAAEDFETYYVVETDGIYAQYLDTRYYIVPYVHTANGYAYGVAKSNSALAYCEYMYNYGEANIKSLVTDLMNYATFARTYFGYTEGLATPERAFNAVLSATEKALAWDNNLIASRPLGQETSSNYVPTAYQIHTNLLEAIKLNFVFKDSSVVGMLYWNSKDYTENDIHDYTTNSGEATISIQNNFVTGAVEGIYAYMIYEDYYIRAYNADGDLSKTYACSVAAYLSNMINYPVGDTAEESAALVEMCKALLIYGDNARTNDAINKG